MTTYTLTPPSIDVTFRRYEGATDPLWRWMKMDTALSLVKVNGTWATARLVSYPDLSVLEAYYQGGYSYEITEEIYDELVADGFGDNVVVTGEDPLTYDEVVLGNAPAVYFKLDDADVAAAISDSSGNAHNATTVAGTNTAAPAITTGATGALSVAPITIGFEVESVTDLVTSAEFTVEMWIQQPGTDGSVSVSMFSDGDASFYAVLNGTGFGPGTERFTFFNDNGDDYELVTGVGMDDGEIYHVVIRVSEEVMTVFSNGVEVDSTATPGTFTSRYLRGGNDLSTDDVLYGPVSLYDSALTDEEILEHYEAGVA